MELKWLFLPVWMAVLHVLPGAMKTKYDEACEVD